MRIESAISESDILVVSTDCQAHRLTEYLQIQHIASQRERKARERKRSAADALKSNLQDSERNSSRISFFSVRLTCDFLFF